MQARQKYIKYALIAVAAVLLSLTGHMIYRRAQQSGISVAHATITAATPADEAESSTVPRPTPLDHAVSAVDVLVLGKVERPGIYYLLPGDPVAVAVTAAGAMHNANLSGVDITRIAQSGDVIEVP